MQIREVPLKVECVAQTALLILVIVLKLAVPVPRRKARVSVLMRA